MAERQWTDAQRRAIEDEGGALLVSAAAGSGKTAVLVERAVRLMAKEQAPVPADRLLILTFTNAAAQELRSRIGLRLEEEIASRPGDAGPRKQQLLLGRTFIGTIDAFCMQLVREHFAALDLAPDVTVADEALLGQLSADALAETMEAMYADADFARFAGLYGRSRSDAAAEGAVLALHAHTRTLPLPEAWLQRYVEMYEAATPLAQSPWGRELLDAASQALADMVETAGRAQALAEETDGFERCAEALKADWERLEEARQAVQQGEWDVAQQLLQGYRFAALRPGRNCDEAVQLQIKQWRDIVKEAHEELLKYCFICTEEEFEADRQAALPLVQALVAATRLYGEKFHQAKLAERVLDFSDFEQLALQLLQQPDGKRTRLAQQVAARYDAVMVDEYQDTNELQDALYGALARKDGANLFFVGDVKQSIYRFRKANPGLFLAKKAAWAPQGSGAHPARLMLGHNFRSSPAVINGVNYLFGQLMSPELGELAYDAEERLLAGAACETAGSFELAVVDGEGSEAEAAFVAGRIAEMVRQGVMVRGKDGPRPCGYGDFCILLRARTHMPAFVAALQAQGILAAADLADGLLETPEVLPLTSVLAAISNPGDDIALAAAMLGPLFRFSAEEMARIRAGSPKGRLWGAVNASGEEKAAAFVKQMAEYRILAAEMPVGRLCEVLVSRSHYLSAVSAMASGASRQENLRRFITWAATVGAAGRGGLAGFVRLLQSGGGPQPPPAGAVTGQVTLLTIHKSKGLEFPVVFLANTAHRFNMRDLAGKVQLDAELGIGLQLRSGSTLFPTLPAMAVRSKAARQTLSEEMRLLYVALTRARDHVVVSFAKKDAAGWLHQKAVQAMEGPPAPRRLAAQRSMADWLVAALLGHGDAELLLADAGVPWRPARSGAEGRFVMRLHTVAGAAAVEHPAFVPTAPPDEALVQALQKGFARQPAGVALAAVPAKMSVSALTKQQDGGLRKRPSFMYGSGLSAAERGTAQHSFMQYCDFAAAGQDLEGEIQRLLAQHFLEQPLADAIDRAGVRRFLASPLMARIRSADTVLREYDFITAVPAGRVKPDLPPQLAKAPVLVQGIADLVLVFPDHAEIVDYKTDKGADGDTLVQRYAGQLQLYRQAVQQRLPVPVTRLTLWPFALAQEVPVPLGDVEGQEEKP